MFETFIISIGSVNFRSGASTSAPVIENLPKGTVFQVLEDGVEGTTYAKVIDAAGRVGYVTNLEKYVQPFEPEWLAKAKKVIEYGRTYIGTPYEYRSDRTNDETFDCSDLTHWCLAKTIGVEIHKSSITQAKDGEPVDHTNFDKGTPNQLRTGDLLLFDTNLDGTINHVGFYVYPRTILHTYSTKVGVVEETLSQARYRQLVAARRVIF